MKNIFIHEWETIGYIALTTIISYIILLVLIRVSGKRTLAKLTAFDFVVTTTLGATLSSMSVGKIPILEGTASLAVIILMRLLIAKFLKSFKILDPFVNSKPTVVFYQGAFLEESMKDVLITREEIYAEIRKNTIHNVEEIEAVVMEQNGDITVVKKSHNVKHSSLSCIENFNP